MLLMEEILNKLKKISGVETDKALALEILGLKPDALVQRKKRGAIPYEAVVSYCLRNKISIDVLFDNKQIIVSSETDINEGTRVDIPNNLYKIQVVDSNESIIIPLQKHDKILTAHIEPDLKTCFIADISIDSFKEDGKYLIKFNGRYFAKKLVTSFRNTYEFSDLSSEENPSSFELSESELLDIEVIGQIIKTIKII